MDILGSVDPYVVLKFGEQEFKSNIKKKSYNPEWNEFFEFAINDNEQGLSLSVRASVSENLFLLHRAQIRCGRGLKFHTNRIRISCFHFLTGTECQRMI